MSEALKRLIGAMSQVLKKGIFREGVFMCISV